MASHDPLPSVSTTSALLVSSRMSRNTRLSSMPAMTSAPPKGLLPSSSMRARMSKTWLRLSPSLTASAPSGSKGWLHL